MNNETDISCSGYEDESEYRDESTYSSASSNEEVAFHDVLTTLSAHTAALAHEKMSRDAASSATYMEMEKEYFDLNKAGVASGKLSSSDVSDRLNRMEASICRISAKDTENKLANKTSMEGPGNSTTLLVVGLALFLGTALYWKPARDVLSKVAADGKRLLSSTDNRMRVLTGSNPAIAGTA